jgi:hypothetical protein
MAERDYEAGSKERDGNRAKGKIARGLVLAINVFSKLMRPLDLKRTLF